MALATSAGAHAPGVAKLPRALESEAPTALEVTVRVRTIAPPVSLRAMPRDAGARVRLCTACGWKAAPSGVAIRGDEERIVTDLGGAEPAATPDARPYGAAVRGVAAGMDSAARQSSGVAFSGTWRFTFDDGGPANSPQYATVNSSGGHLRITLTLPMEEYVASVLGAEASNFTAPESLKAMAVAVRTYAAHFRSRHRAASFDFCDSTHCQAMRLAGVGDRFRAAARATAGEVLLYEGRPATTYYHNDCGGTTEAAGIAWRDPKTPYLRQVADPYCVRPAHEGWTTEIPQSDLARALSQAKIEAPAGWRGIEVVTRTPSGRAHKLRLVGDTNLLIGAMRFRMAVARTLGAAALRSDLYEVHPGTRPGEYVFHGTGAGHGIGLCQAGALEMGSEGKPYAEILAFYYPGTTLAARAHNTAALSEPRVGNGAAGPGSAKE